MLIQVIYVTSVGILSIHTSGFTRASNGIDSKTPTLSFLLTSSGGVGTKIVICYESTLLFFNGLCKVDLSEMYTLADCNNLFHDYVYKWL